MLVSIALAGATCTSIAQEASTSKRTIRLEFVSTLPEALTYYDEGFNDFIRDSKQVPLTTLSVNNLAMQSFLRGLDSLNIDVALSGEVSRMSTQEDIDRLITELPGRADVDALVVLSPGATRSERFMKGMAVMTKIGLLGIDKLTVVFTMPKFSIYSRQSAKPCVTLNPVRTKRIPAIYSNWSTDMTNGPTESLHQEMQSIVGSELPMAVSDGIASQSRNVLECFKSSSQ